MKWLQKLSSTGKMLRECLSEVGFSRFGRRSGILADKLIENSMQRVPLLRQLDTLVPPQEEADLLRTTVEHMPGKEWVNKIADQAERLEPNPYGPPRYRGH